MAPHVARRSAGKLGGRDERWETFVEYNVLNGYPWHAAEYATAFSAPDWLYLAVLHRIKYNNYFSNKDQLVSSIRR